MNPDFEWPVSLAIQGVRSKRTPTQQISAIERCIERLLEKMRLSKEPFAIGYVDGMISCISSMDSSFDVVSQVIQFCREKIKKRLSAEKTTKLNLKKIDFEVLARFFYSLRVVSNEELLVVNLFLEEMCTEWRDENPYLYKNKLSDNLDNNLELMTIEKQNYDSMVISACLGLHGLQNMHANSSGVQLAVDAIARQLKLCLRQHASFAYIHLSMAMVGLRCMSSEHQECLDAVGILVDLAERSFETNVDPMVGEEISLMLAGLCHKNNDNINGSVARMLKFTAARMVESFDMGVTLAPFEVALAFGGMQSLHADSPDVRTIIGLLSDSLVNSQMEGQWLNATAIVVVLNALQRMDHCSIELQKLLRILANQIKKMPEDISNDGAATALHGLQMMDSSCDSVNELLDALSQKIFTSNEELSSIDAGRCLNGFRSMTKMSHPLSVILMKIAEKMKDSNVAPMQPSSMMLCIQGIAHFNPDEYEEAKAICAGIRSRMFLGPNEPFPSHSNNEK